MNFLTDEESVILNMIAKKEDVLAHYPYNEQYYRIYERLRSRGYIRYQMEEDHIVGMILNEAAKIALYDDYRMRNPLTQEDFCQHDILDYIEVPDPNPRYDDPHGERDLIYSITGRGKIKICPLCGKLKKTQ